MGTLGNKPAAGFQSIEKQSITGNGNTSYALDHAVTNVNDLEVFVNNVRQEPTTAYTISGQNIVMSEAIANTDSFYVIYQSRAFTKAVPADTSVTTAMLQDNSVTSAKIAATNGLTIDNNAATVLTADRSGAVGSIIDVQKAGSTVGQISNIGNDFVVGSSTGSGAGLRFDGSGNLMYPSNSLGNSRDNAVDLGASSVRFKDLYLGGGAYIGGTAAANKLDDYEEGTFTFGMDCLTSGSFTPRAGYTLGHYTRIGNTVHYIIRFESLGRSSPQGRIRITSFPFTFKANITNGPVAQDFPCLLRGQDPPSEYMTYFFVAAQNDTWGYFAIRQNNSTHGYTVIDQSHIPGNFEGALNFTAKIQ